MQDMPLELFRFRLSARNPRDVQLSQWIKQDTEHNGVNVSEVIKTLLYAWYMQRHEQGVFPAMMPVAALPGPATQEEEREDPNDPLVRNLLNLGFEEL